MYILFLRQKCSYRVSLLCQLIFEACIMWALEYVEFELTTNLMHQ